MSARIRSRNPPDPAPGADAWTRGTAACGIAIVVLAAASRVYAAGGDFWFDEIWSWTIALKAESWWSILTELKHDNNHYLNTWILYVLGPQRHWMIYRLPAVAAGVLSVWLAGRIGARRGTVESLTSAALVGGSYLCIHYASEARGYSYALMFGFLAFLLARGYVHRPTWIRALSFGAVVLAGLLAHLTFLHAYLALIAWTGWRLGRSSAGRILWLRAHLVPVVGWIGLYFLGVQGMKVGGGTFVSAGDAAAQALSLSAGGPLSGPMTIPFALGAVVLGAFGIAERVRRQDDEWVFHAIAIVAAPLLLILVAGREDYYPRYFLLAAGFLLMLIGETVGGWLRRPGSSRIVAAALLVAVLSGNALHAERLFRLGRGRCREAIQVMLEANVGNPSTLGSMHDFRTETIVRYYQSWIPGSGRIYYFRKGRWPVEGPEWFLAHDFDPDHRPDERTDLIGGQRYRLFREFRHAGLSGWNWYLYRNENRTENTLE